MQESDQIGRFLHLLIDRVIWPVCFTLIFLTVIIIVLVYAIDLFTCQSVYANACSSVLHRFLSFRNSLYKLMDCE